MLLGAGSPARPTLDVNKVLRLYASTVISYNAQGYFYRLQLYLKGEVVVQWAREMVYVIRRCNFPRCDAVECMDFLIVWGSQWEYILISSVCEQQM